MNAVADSQKAEYIPSIQGQGNLARLSPRIRQELRILAPYALAIVVCELLMLAAHILGFDSKSKSVQFFAITCNAVGGALLPVSVCALCLQSFLAEFHDATVIQWITQPVTRRQLWMEKLSITGCTLLVTAVIGFLIIVVYTLVAGPPSTHLDSALAMLATVGLAFLATVLFAAPLCVMIMRRPLASLLVLLGFVFVVICILVDLTRRLFSQRDIEQSLITVWLINLSILSFLAAITYTVAYRRFLRLEV